MSDRTDTFYPAEGAIHGYGAQLMVGDGASPESFEAIAAVVSITPGAMNTADIDRTHLRSPAAHREHMPGLRDSAAFTCELIWLVTEQSQSHAGGGSGAFANGGTLKLWEDRSTHNFKIALHDGGSPGTDWPFRGYVSQFQPGSITGDDKINATASFQPTQSYSENLP